VRTPLGDDGAAHASTMYVAPISSAAGASTPSGAEHDTTDTSRPSPLHHSGPTQCTENKKLSYRRGTARCVVSVEILPRSSAETTYTTSPEQIEVMKLESYGGPMCNKHVHSTMTRSSRFHCPIDVINKPTMVELWISHVYRRLAVAKFSKSTL